ncbi:MAG: sigma-54 dependent transcriptional regulator [Myxococcota bacterium]
MARVWAVDDHRVSLDAMAEIAARAGHEVARFDSAEALFAALSAEPAPDVVITDLRLPGADGQAVVTAVKRREPAAEVVVVTAFGSIDDAVRAIRAGAFEFLLKPLSIERVEVVLRNAVDRAGLARALAAAHTENRALRDLAAPSDLVWRSARMAEVLDRVRRAADSDATVVLLGESGTGKERLARRVHDGSPRASRPFVPVHLAALAEGVLESELFGHEKGAFTGATARHPGRFEQAHGGTLFLDEVAEIDLRVQVKLLRVLQERTVERVGGRTSVPIDVRLVAATHKDLEREVTDGRFREDLFYRLDVVRIVVPPLRERREDIPVLLGAFLERFAVRYGRPVPDVGPDLLQALLAWDWPGNVRELENAAERLVVLGRGTVTLDDIPARIARRPATAEVPPGDLDLTAYLEDLEQTLLRRALTRSGGNKAQAARSLGLSREALRYKLQKYGIDGE